MERIFTLCNKDLGEAQFRTKTSMKSFINQKGTRLPLEACEPVNTNPNSTLATIAQYTASPVWTQCPNSFLKYSLQYDTLQKAKPQAQDKLVWSSDTTENYFTYLDAEG